MGQCLYLGRYWIDELEGTKAEQSQVNGGGGIQAGWMDG